MNTMRSDAAADDIFTFEVYVGDRMTIQGSGRAQDVMSRARTYAVAGELDQFYLYPKDSTSPTMILYRDEILASQPIPVNEQA